MKLLKIYLNDQFNKVTFNNMSVRFFAVLTFYTISVYTSSAVVDPQKIYLAVNRDNPNSRKTAEFYCKLRNVPLSNILELDAGNSGHITRAHYINKIENPIVRELVARGAVKAISIGRKDSYGRDEYLYTSHNVDFIIMCFMPWGIISSVKDSNPVKTDAASVDSEISARFLTQQTLSGACKNPLYKNFSSSDLAKAYGVLRVARLDGKSFESAKGMLLSAAEAERMGVRGRGYIDMSKKMRMGDDWLAHCAEFIKSAGYDISVDVIPELFDFSTRYDAMLFYFGWYAHNPKFFFNEKNFRLAPGAIALHIYSFSASQLRSRKDWTGMFIDAGAAQTFGNVYEPFLGMTQNPIVLMTAFSKGLCAGEAAYASVPFLSWQTLWLGDPLYLPYRVPLDEQIKILESGKADEYSQYAIIRQMNILVADGKTAEARKLGESWVGRIPDIAILWWLLCEARATGNSSLALQYADMMAGIPPSSEYLGLYVELSDFYGASRESAPKALAVMRSLRAITRDEYFQKMLIEKIDALCDKYKLDGIEESNCN